MSRLLVKTSVLVIVLSVVLGFFIQLAYAEQSRGNLEGVSFACRTEVGASALFNVCEGSLARKLTPSM